MLTQPSPTLRSHPSTLLALLAGVALATACSDEPELPSRHGGLDLLGRGPDGVIAASGEILPAAGKRWGVVGDYRVALSAEWEGAEPVAAWSSTATVALELAGAAPADGALVVSAWQPRAARWESQRGEVRLNGRVLGALDLDKRPVEARFAVERSAWKADGNELELVVTDATESERAEPMPLRDVLGEDGTFVLEHGEGLVYSLELLGPTFLKVAGTSEGEGVLALTIDFVDPETGEVHIVEESRRELSLRGGELFARQPLGADTREHPIRIELVWEGVDAPLRIHELGLEEEQPAERPPIVFISIDTLAARHMSIYGYGRETTPNIDRFGRDAVVFDHCMANAPWTLASYMSQMTGLYSYSHNQAKTQKDRRELDFWETWYLAENRLTLAESLRAAGYRTAGFVDNLWIIKQSGMTQGFELYDSSAGEIGIEDSDGGIRHVLPLARSWLASLEREEPFFLFLHAFDVHGPYKPPPPFEGEFTGDEHFDAEAKAFAGSLTNVFGSIPESIARGVVPQGEIPPELPVGPIHADYDEGILSMDAQVGAFLDHLKAVGLYDRAIIVLSADHGETMVDHDYYFGHGVMYEPVVHVPLIVRLPGGKGRGRRVDTSVQLVDLYPTLLDLVGLGAERDYLHGRSLRPALEGEELEPVATFTEGGIMMQSAVEADGWKLIAVFPGEQTRSGTIFTNPRLPAEYVDEHVPEVRERAMTAELLKTFEKRLERKDWREARRHLEQFFYELYYLPDDPDELENRVERNPDMFRSMKFLLQQERLKREIARDHAELDPGGEREMRYTKEDRDELINLGYLDSETESDEVPPDDAEVDSTPEGAGTADAN